LKSSILPSKVLILLAGSCLLWVGILVLAFVGFSGARLSAGWLFAGALFFSLLVWTAMMAAEFRSAVEQPVRVLDEDSADAVGLTSPLPSQVQRREMTRGFWSGRRFLPIAKRPKPRRRSRAERPMAR
jgi:membrane protein implicated in regulation of membrane protease activity